MKNNASANNAFLMAMASMFDGSSDHLPKTDTSDLAGVDIEKEYELIKQKKSKLSAVQRKRVVRRFEAANSNNINSEG